MRGIKKPVTAFMYFQKRQTKNGMIKVVDGHFTAIGPTLSAAELREQWRNLAPIERAEYDLMARRDKKRYEKQVRLLRAAIDPDGSGRKIEKAWQTYHSSDAAYGNLAVDNVTWKKK